MVDRDKRPFEERVAAIDDWIIRIARKGVVGDMDPSLLKGVFVELGADFREKPELQALSRYSNYNKKPGMDAVWGEQKMDSYTKWTQDYVAEYEIRSGRELPRLQKDSPDEPDIKNSGMRQFLGELTAFAAGQMTFEKYKRITQNRSRKGREWQNRKIGDPIIPSKNSSFPPEFPIEAWEIIKTWRVE